MRIIVCVDERGGMLFNRRRQSRDRAVTEDIVASLGKTPLHMAPMSEPLFREQKSELIVREDFLSQAGRDDVCFVEDRPLAALTDQIEQITLYCWNRHYPADLRFDIDLRGLGFRLEQTRELAGYSHEIITKEIYCK